MLNGVATVSPWNGQQNVGLGDNISISFDFDADAATVNVDTIQLRNPAGALVPSTVTYDSATNTATLNPDSPLLSTSNYYAVTVTNGILESGTGTPIDAPYLWAFTTQAPTFQDIVALDGLIQPTVVRFADDGRVFVAEKSGLIKVFDGLDDPNGPEVFADLRPQVHNYWDRGLLGMDLHPDFPASPYVYVHYTYNAPLDGSPFPAWPSADGTNDSGPGTSGNGPPVSSNLSRLTVGGDGLWDGNELVLINDWPSQYPSHAVGSVEFGPDGMLYVSAGDGASFGFSDFGQFDSLLGSDALNDPPNEGGALRSLDLRTSPEDPSVDPVSLDGTIIRVHPDTGAAVPTNPLYDRYGANDDPNAERVLAYGLRNPFRFTVRDNGEVWVGDVGWNTFEEINVVRDPVDSIVENFGWPAYEGDGPQGGYDGLNLPLIEQLYQDVSNDPNNPKLHAEPFFKYRHTEQVDPGTDEPIGSSAISGLAFYSGTNYPMAFDGALFFSDFNRARIWVMHAGVDGEPDPNSIATVFGPSANSVGLYAGPDGDIYYTDLLGGKIRRITYFADNLPPTAVAIADVQSGAAPLTVNFDGTTSFDTDPGDVIASYEWDLDGDGQFDDSTSPQPSFTYPSIGGYNVSLRATDSQGLTHVDSLIVNVGDPPTVLIDSPTVGQLFSVGEVINFSGLAYEDDAVDETDRLDDSALTWTFTFFQASEENPNDFNIRNQQVISGAGSGQYTVPDWEFPVFFEVELSATDSDGLVTTEVIRVDPQTVVYSFDTVPTGLQVDFNGRTKTAPFDQTLVVNSLNTISVLSPQVDDGTLYEFESWSDGGAISHDVVVGPTPDTIIANFAPFSITYLSDLAFVGTPVNGWGPVERDRSNGEQGSSDGNPITLDGVTYAKGLGAHSASEIVYSLQGQFDRFNADVGVDDEVDGLGSVTFEVWLDGTQVYGSGVLTGASPTESIDVSVAGGTELRLIVTDADDGASYDHADWADAKLLASPSANLPPVAAADLNSIAEGETDPVAGDLLVNDSDPNDDLLVIQSVAASADDQVNVAGAYGTLDWDGSGTYIYRVDNNNPVVLALGLGEVLTDVFDYTIADGNGGTDTSTLTVTIQGVDNTESVYLSDWPFASPPVNGFGPVERDRSNGENGPADGNTLTLEGTTYTKGFGVHSASELVFDLQEQFDQFVADIGVDDEVGNLGQVTFEVWLDGVQIFDSGVMTGSSLTQTVGVSVAGGTLLRLVVTDGGDGLAYDHANWADAKLVSLASVNFAPEAVDDVNSVTEGDIAPATGDLLQNDSDPDEDLLTVASVNGETDAAVAVVGVFGTLDWSTAGGYAYTLDNTNAVVQTLVSGETATDVFSYAIADGNGGVDSATLTITIQGVGSFTQTYLSDLPFVGTPINGWGPVERDRSNGEQGSTDGNMLTLNGTTYAKGLGVHSASEIVFDLQGQYDRFVSDVGVDDEVGNLGQVTFEVWLDGLQVYDSGVVTGSSATSSVDVNVAGGSDLRLVVTDGGDGLSYDHADWADARLLTIDESSTASNLSLAFGLPGLTATTTSSGTGLVADDDSATDTSADAIEAELADLVLASDEPVEDDTSLSLANGGLSELDGESKNDEALEAAFAELPEEL